MGLTYKHPDSPASRYRKSGDRWEVAFAEGLAFVQADTVRAAELDADLKAGKLTALPRKSAFRPDDCCDKRPFCLCDKTKKEGTSDA